MVVETNIDEFVLGLMICIAAPFLVELVIDVIREKEGKRRRSSFIRKVKRRVNSFLLASVLTIGIYVSIVVLHEVLHTLLLYLAGKPAYLKINMNGFTLIKAYVYTISEPQFPFTILVPIVGTLSSVIFLVLIASIFKTKRDASLWFFLFTLTDICINLFTNIGDGAFLPTPKIPAIFVPIVASLRIIALSGFTNSLIFNDDPVDLNWI